MKSRRRNRTLSKIPLYNKTHKIQNESDAVFVAEPANLTKR